MFLFDSDPGQFIFLVHRELLFDVQHQPACLFLELRVVSVKISNNVVSMLHEAGHLRCNRETLEIHSHSVVPFWCPIRSKLPPNALRKREPHVSDFGNMAAKLCRMRLLSQTDFDILAIHPGFFAPLVLVSLVRFEPTVIFGTVVFGIVVFGIRFARIGFLCVGVVGVGLFGIRIPFIYRRLETMEPGHTQKHFVNGRIILKATVQLPNS